jgi:ricin-type beta-trefoil lectin protein
MRNNDQAEGSAVPEEELQVKRGRIVSVVIGLTAALASVPASASLAAAASTPGDIYNFMTNQCLQPVNGSTAQGAAIVQEPCTMGAAQQWVSVPAGGDVVHYQNVLTGLCLDARGGAANHTPVQQWTCNGISNENWQPGDDGDDEIPPLTSRVSGTSSYCLDIPGGQATVGLAMQLYRCNGTEAQQWWLPY